MAERRRRMRTRRVVAFVSLALGALVVLSAEAADQIVPIVAHVSGAMGSVWRSDLKLHNVSDRTITGVLIFTPRNQSASGNDIRVPFTLLPGAVSVLTDVYATVHPGSSGADRVVVKVDTDPATGRPFPAPVIDTATYNLATDGGEFGQSPQVFWSDSWHAMGATLFAVLGKGEERDGLLVMTAERPVSIEWRYTDASGGNSFTTSKTYGPDMTFQYTGGVKDVLGFSPAANGTLAAKITDGKARVALTHNNNRTNDPRWCELAPRWPGVPYGVAFGVDYGQPERYLVQGEQSQIANPAVVDPLRGSPQSLTNLGEIYFWMKSEFVTWSAGGSTIGTVTTGQLLRDRRLGGCHDWGLVYASVARELGYPAVMVDALNLTWAQQYKSGQPGPYFGHVFVEVFVGGVWVLIDSTNNWFVETGYDPANPVIPLRTANDAPGGVPYGYYVMRKGLDTWGYGVYGVSDLHRLMERTAGPLNIDTLVYPVYHFQSFIP